MMETFADSITGVTFDGQALRLEFSVTRMDNVKPNSPVPAGASQSAAWCCSRSPRLT